jgi:hypothetical protein
LQREKHALIQLLIVVLRMATTNTRLVRKNLISEEHVHPIKLLSSIRNLV